MSRTSRPRAYNNLPQERYQGRASFGEPPPKEIRKKLADETLSMIPSVLTTMGFGEQPESTLFSSQLEPLDNSICPGYTFPDLKVRYADTFSLARQLLKTRPDYLGKVAVLNCASDTELAGGWRHRSGTTQEDALCYSSTLWPTLDRWKSKYPWRNTVNRSGGNAGEDWTTVSVVSVAGLACPPLVPAQKGKARGEGEMQMKLEKDVHTIKERFRMILRMAARQDKSLLLLAALGCGVWKCPPRQIAELLKECLGEPEFNGWFEDIWVGIYDEEVCRIWREVLGAGSS
ncbi:hypothetical protein PV05_02321 [Exophiala xenobiotica]|uniref:Microbial-type PARG catalytic domain-containing protein n=1 Tax=Exophiala xenobiotica TaxID=348802 RepID=A0A0D2BZ87_9EURO|nr:uncharacterized protein PV05_02321 [Exophiala xenobiotica]KIW57761.1 hypothetical protein PV05_02321 [Exophiala xenobiotica]